MSRGAVVLADAVLRVATTEWHERIADLVAGGHAYLHSLGAVDELGRQPVIRIVCRLWRFGADTRVESVRVETLVARGDTPDLAGRLPSVSDLLPGAGWYEREIHDFFGVGFDHPDAAATEVDLPLLNLNDAIRPLRKDFVLAARVATPWPGAKEPGEDAAAPSRRRMAPVGVPDQELWGRRGVTEPPPSPDDIAAAMAGGRVRRRR